MTLGDALAAHDRAIEFGGLAGHHEPIAYRVGHRASLLRLLPQHCQEGRRARAQHGATVANKRTALILLELLLTRSGYELTEDEDPLAAADMVLAVVENRMSVEDIEAWLKARIRKA